jgi:hypothetical protein
MSPNDNLTTTRSVVTDYFNWRLNNKTDTNNRLFVLVRNIAYDCEILYNSQQPTFNLHSSSLIDIKNLHFQVAKELFTDDIITWSRILAFISFSAILAQPLLQRQEDIDSIIDFTTDFIDVNCHTWLESQNYWVNHFKYTQIF